MGFINVWKVSMQRFGKRILEGKEQTGAFRICTLYGCKSEKYTSGNRKRKKSLANYRGDGFKWTFLRVISGIIVQRKVLGCMKPFGDGNFDTVEQDFPVEYVQAKPTAW